MSQVVTRYHSLYESLRTRRRRPRNHTGLDSIANHLLLRIRNRKISLRWLRDQVSMIETLAPDLKSHSDRALDDVVRECREFFVRGRQDDQVLRRSLAVIREVARRETGEEAYPVQLMGALALYHGRIAEMKTGEGKTLTGSIVAPLLAWRHRHLHVLTVNDYLAQRDAESRAGIYRRCLCTVGAIHHQLEPSARFEVYARSIVYGTPKQITADWLRDQIRLGPVSTPWWGRQAMTTAGAGAEGIAPMIPGLRAALVDEADAVLIDEGVVPLIIARSRREDEMAGIYQQAAALAARLNEGADYRVDHLRRRADLSRNGSRRIAMMCGGNDGERVSDASPTTGGMPVVGDAPDVDLTDPIWRATRRAEELVRQALVARHCYLNGRQYQLVDGRVVIVDEYTGRFLPDRSWEHGLHQAVEAKEGVAVTADRETLARLSFQRFFRMYPVLCGMTGTAADATIEMEKVYSRPVTIIPTNRPVIRTDDALRIFRTSEGRWNAVVNEIEAVHQHGQPVLIGTRSIEASMIVSERLAARGLTHRVLNANFDKDEAEMISVAGKRRAMTVATNMAGRGTDIKPDKEAIDAGGLVVILTEMHSAKRIDRQFMGRSGRQGDPGRAVIFVSLEDELVRLHARHLSARLRGVAGHEELTGRIRALAAAVFRLAQRRAESRARTSRAEVLRQDDWIDQHLPGR